MANDLGRVKVVLPISIERLKAVNYRHLEPLNA